jgi:signal transduction histidine kinase
MIQGSKTTRQRSRKRIHSLSDRLHSTKLEYLGLGAAAAGLCKKPSRLQNVDVNFHCEAIPKELPKKIALCLYRILQEALQNAIKHSDSRVFEVSLSGQSNEIQLTVRDRGVGSRRTECPSTPPRPTTASKSAASTAPESGTVGC